MTNAFKSEGDQPRSKKPFIVLGLILGLVPAVYGAFIASDLLARSTTILQVSVLPADEPIREINLDLGCGSISLVAWDEVDVSGERTVKRGQRKPTFSEKLDKGILRLTTKCPIGSVFASVDYDLRVPRNVTITGSLSGGSFDAAGVEGDMTLDSSGGSIAVSDTKGAIDLKSSGGSVSSERSTGNLKLDSDGGSVDARDASGDTLKADSSGGSVSVMFTEPPTKVDASSGGGSVTVVVPKDDTGYKVDASSSGGNSDVTVSTDPDSSSTIKAKSSGGDVSVRYPE
jgi:hypothetical protein